MMKNESDLACFERNAVLRRVPECWRASSATTKAKAAKMQRATRSNACSCSFGVELHFSVYVKLQINLRQSLSYCSLFSNVFVRGLRY